MLENQNLGLLRTMACLVRLLHYFDSLGWAVEALNNMVAGFLVWSGTSCTT